ncbi:pyridoxamine 5'-phosphate oxidase [Halarcobacter anaerophilus]|uniref:Pyridoxamine 5'-phosphate oxidase n=1 Tax=Halarcobacter anaerophilus TaxID=877500 RepID=A0A4Q0XZ80_9BACT|nr:pyridoxamine 5'-phosphate oxidase [Halarcobacter anaerophilus]QDF28828.1 pyridoxine 5'-phosphate oxidase / pyridoxamine 5'-phosphate oxidase [Halarcobacter anaerophilus]RXJ61261.1 pyridoxamine 5'-phosphate oxidase [Halarcobacter anaerophilus]
MVDLSKMRQEYSSKGLRKEDLEDNPFKQFEKWFNEALKAELIEPNAFTLATVGKDLKPSQRTVLLKMYDKEGFTFFSNYESKKAKQIDENSNISAHFAWLGLERQVRIEGIIKKISKTESLKYFLSRPKGSQLGAWVSHQSQVVTSRSILETKFDEMRKKFAKGEIPFPSFWGGYQIIPNYFEFWQGALNRLHDRFVYKLVENRWEVCRLEP